jgi:hypothetical protein
MKRSHSAAASSLAGRVERPAERPDAFGVSTEMVRSVARRGPHVDQSPIAVREKPKSQRLPESEQRRRGDSFDALKPIQRLW